MWVTVSRNVAYGAVLQRSERNSGVSGFQGTMRIETFLRVEA